MEEQYFSCWPAKSADIDWVQKNYAEHGQSFLIPWPQIPHASSSSSSTVQVQRFPSLSIPLQETAEDTTPSVSNSHSLAEKRRRDRINTQLGILRKLIPKSDKMDKAALLASVVDCVKDLKHKAMEVSRSSTVPTEIDEVTVDCVTCQESSASYVNKDKNSGLIRASVCCDDRPELFSEIIRTLKSLGLAVVRADIASVGGRVKSILLLCTNNGSKEDVSLVTVKQSLKVVLARIASSSMPLSNRVRSKRQRFFFPS
ncbi:hypothetical protein K2173_002910 [Erythroxylum novogranatense]|uniref:BHLH domain-containing protein n=1 Tax=Erythroxylum novogranatense TaxID=1862640 RepID=A0AAV8TR37_9ROSI|nr:hypothetical protein K2173_002910 [Erythroxylum novogranatense]